jgi:hypothetical protein
MADQEIEAMAKVGAALETVVDVQARARVLRWANEKFGFVPTTTPLSTKAVRGVATSGTGAELPGIGVMGEGGNVRFTIRDPKAKSARDATTRLAYVAIHATEMLTGKKGASRKSAVVPLLKHWRVYDGNARQFLARDKGILKNGDDLTLDGHAQKDAARYMEEMQDSNLSGSWKPGNSSRKPPSKAAKPRNDTSA